MVNAKIVNLELIQLQVLLNVLYVMQVLFLKKVLVIVKNVNLDFIQIKELLLVKCVQLGLYQEKDLLNV